MGETLTKIKVYNLRNTKFAEIKILADTGATYTSIPKEVLESLEVTITDKITLKLADGRAIQRNLGNILAEVEGRMRATPVIFGEKDDATILGLVTLESCGLTVDTINRKLVPLPEIHHYGAQK